MNGGGGQNAQGASETGRQKGKNLFPVAGKKLKKGGAPREKNAQQMEMEKMLGKMCKLLGRKKSGGGLCWAKKLRQGCNAKKRT